MPSLAKYNDLLMDRLTGMMVNGSDYWKGGAIDYKKVPVLAGIDLEQYRSAAREEVRVSVAKNC